MEGKGCLIIGASGSGKSSLSLQLIACGATLIADDRTCVDLHADALIASALKPIQGLIEARGIGLLRAQTKQSTTVKLIVDMDQTETQRMPYPHHYCVLGKSIVCLHKVDSPTFAFGIRQYLLHGRSEDS